MRYRPGWLLFLCPPLVHNDPALFGEPQRYDPYRFAPEGDDQAAGNLFGFGGGTHRCLGASFARNEMKVILTQLLRRYELTLVNPDPQPDPDVVGAVPPTAPCLVRYRRRTRAVRRAVCGAGMQTLSTDAFERLDTERRFSCVRSTFCYCRLVARRCDVYRRDGL